MRPSYLIDTHVLLWALCDDPRLAKHHRALIERNEGLAVSAVTIWEMSIKRSIGKLDFDGDLVEPLVSRAIPIIAITEHHAVRVQALARHHGDPFDRLLIAQAQVENLSILTGNALFARYDVAIV